MISDIIARQGALLFRWRSYALLIFLPLAFMIVIRPEPVEVTFGEATDLAWEIACIVIAFIGLGVRIVTIGFTPKNTSGRNTATQVADTLNTTGMYSVVRNPLYLGNAIIYMGFALFSQTYWFVIIMFLFLVLYLERIIAAEETFLRDRFGAEYEAWTRRVPAFIPDFSLWTSPPLPFSFRNILKREYSGFFGIIAAIVLFDYAREAIAEGETQIGLGWFALFCVGAVVYVVLRSLKRHTELLDVPGR
jgi:protein-S-isoprenylcysteine O-methyltransferase Ste14